MNSYIVRNSKGCTQQDVTKNYSKTSEFQDNLQLLMKN